MGKKKNNETIKQYVEGLPATPNFLFAHGKWQKVHGDGKSGTGGKFHMRSILEQQRDKKGKVTSEKWKVKIYHEGSPVPSSELSYNAQPTSFQIVQEYKTRYG